MSASVRTAQTVTGAAVALVWLVLAGAPSRADSGETPQPGNGQHVTAEILGVG